MNFINQIVDKLKGKNDSVRMNKNWPTGRIEKGDHSCLVYSDWPNDKLKWAAEKLRNLGCAVSRNEVPWNILEPVQGQVDWNKLDRVVNALLDEGITPLLVLSNAPKWVTGSDDPCYMPSDEVGFQTFMKVKADWAMRVALRYGSKVYYSIENEWNMKRFTPLFRKPAYYVKLAIAVYDAIKSVCPETRIAFGSGITSMDTDAEDRMKGSDFLQGILTQVVKANRTDVLKIVDIHAYGGPAQINTVRRILDSKGLAKSEIWVTEIGKKSIPNEKTQADWMRAALNNIDKYGYGVTMIVWFWVFARNAYDAGNTNPDIDPYALITVDGREKLAAETFRRVT